MLLLGKQLKDFREEDFASLKDGGVSESRAIEYKRDLPGILGDERKEFLYDVAAMANGGGGCIFYGIDAKDGAIESSPGVPANADKTRLDFESRIRDGIAPRVRVHIWHCELESKNNIFFIEIPPSWSAPHMVIYKDSNKFYSRNSSGKYRMSVDEIKAMILNSAELPERIERWISERLLSLANGDSAVRLHPLRWIAIHIVPTISMSRSASLDVAEKAFESVTLNREFRRKRYNLDGLLYHMDSTDDYGGQYLQIFRTGRIELVTAIRAEGFLINSSVQGDCLNVNQIEHDLIALVSRCLEFLQISEVEPPLTINVSSEGVKGLTAFIPPQNRSTFINLNAARREIQTNRLRLPSIWLEDWKEAEEVDKLLRPAFNAFWNACGWPNSPNYDEHGNWQAIHR